MASDKLRGCFFRYLHLTLNLTAWEFKKLFRKNENKYWMVEAKYLKKKIRNASQKI
jgi:hypothetical protein